MGFWADLITRIRGADYQGWDLSALDLQKNVSLKNLALETCSNYVARVFSKSEFVVKADKERIKDDTYYVLNVRPNPNQTASEFKAKMVQNYLNNGELLVVRINNYLYVADGFVTNYSLQGNSFTGVTISTRAPDIDLGYFDKTFNQGIDCFYIQNENESLVDFINGLWDDYGTLFAGLFANQKRLGQIRAVWKMPDNTKLDEDRKKTNKSVRDGVVKSIDSGNTTLIPVSTKDDYNEVSASKSSALVSQVPDIRAMKDSYVDDVADILGIPRALIHGEMASAEENWNQFIEVVILPIAKKISESLIYLLYGSSGFKLNKTIDIRGFKSINILELADRIDKIAASGVVTINEVREELNYDSIPGGDVFIMTKNYQKGDDN